MASGSKMCDCGVTPSRAQIMDIQYLKSRLEYRDGKLFWLNGIRAGNEAGSLTTKGYRSLSYSRSKPRVYLHRVIFAFHHGYLPKFVDHINGIRDDNRIENLRPATRLQQNLNTKVRKDNATGIKGVSFRKDRKKWQARIKHAGKEMHLGFFDDIGEAATARKDAEKRLHGEFARKL